MQIAENKEQEDIIDTQLRKSIQEDLPYGYWVIIELKILLLHFKMRIWLERFQIVKMGAPSVKYLETEEIEMLIDTIWFNIQWYKKHIVGQDF